MDRLKVLTLNIWNRSGPWEQRLALIRSELEELKPDIVGLQEVLAMPGFPNQAASIAEGLSGLSYELFYSPAWEIGGGLLFGNAILSRFDILETATWPLPSDGKEERALAFARLDTPFGAVPVFNTHLSWRLHQGSIRLAQVEEITTRIANTAPLNGFPPILLGDMNAVPDSDEMRALRGLRPLGERSVYFADCWDYLAQDDDSLGPGHTFSRQNGYALCDREPSRRIDYIYVRGPDRQLRGEPLTARVVFDRSRDRVWPSDHYGVYAEIQAEKRTYTKG